MSAVSSKAVQQSSPAPESPGDSPFRSAVGATVQALAVPLLAVFTAFVVGGLIIWATTGDILKAIGPNGAFVGLWQGAVGSPQNIADTLQTATPYIFAGLAVALAFKCGLFQHRR